MFRSISATNFFSWKQLDFEFKPGVTLIDGINLDDNTSEGSGKSSIVNALCWCLYGQLPKDVNIDDVIRTGQKSGQVSVFLTDGTEIKRTRKPNDLVIVTGQNAGQRGKDVKDTQKMINELIGMSFETFCQSVYFAQNYNNKFITANQEEKGKILSELQDLSIFDKASKKAAEMLRDAKAENLQLENKKLSKIGFHDLVQSEFKTFCELSDNFDTDKLKRLDTCIAETHRIGAQMIEVENELKSIDLEHTLNSLELKMDESRKLKEKLDSIRKKLYHIKMLKLQQAQASSKSSCPTCGQKIEGNHNIHLDIPDDKELLNTETILSEEINAIDLECAGLINKKNRNSLLLERFNQLVEQRKMISKQVNEIESLNNPYLDKITELNEKSMILNNELILIDNKLAENTKYINNLEFLKLGYKEIKSYVFQNLLHELNNRVNKYLTELFDIPAYITFDNISEEGEISKIKTSVTLDGYERSLGLLSGGQFRRVQLAVDFALSDIVSNRSKNPINIRILDEVCKDLSENSMEKVVDILRRMEGSTVIIEHNSMIKNIVNNVFKVELKDGTSTVR